MTGLILAIESSCDDTACAILADDGSIIAESVQTQQAHAIFGGVVPEVAARAHLSCMSSIVQSTLDSAKLTPRNIAIVAATSGPGLIGGLIVGTNFAKGIALALECPFIAVNHIEAHSLIVRLPAISDHKIGFPYLLLLVSGGHCQCVAVRGIGNYHKLGGTIDDAIGEAFDKTAKILGLGWPGGAALEGLAQQGDPHAYSFPRPLFHRSGCDFSFSGLKAAVVRLVSLWENRPLPQQTAADIAASFQQAVVDIIGDRVTHAFGMMPEAKYLVAAGGVAANLKIRAQLAKIADENHIPFAAPPLQYCTDNAVMVAWAALEIIIQARKTGRIIDDIDFLPRPRWPLEDIVL